MAAVPHPLLLHPPKRSSPDLDPGAIGVQGLRDELAKRFGYDILKVGGPGPNESGSSPRNPTRLATKFIGRTIQAGF